MVIEERVKENLSVCFNSVMKCKVCVATNRGERAELNLDIERGHAAEQRTSIVYCEGGGCRCSHGARGHSFTVSV